MKTLVLVFAMLVVTAVGCSAEMITVDCYATRSLLALPQVPFNPDPLDVFGQYEEPWGTIDPSYNITRWDPMKAGVGGYVAFDPDHPERYGGMLLGDGFWVLATAEDDIVYDAVPDGVPDDTPTMTDMWVSLPGMGAGTGGRHIVGSCFNHDISIDKGTEYGDNIFFTDGTTLKYWGEAVDEGWVNLTMTYWNGTTYKDLYADSATGKLVKQRAYWLLTFVDNLAMIVPAY